mgnify:FL=1
MLVKYGLWGFMKSNLTKSVVVLAGFALLYVLTRIPLAHVGERVVSCDSYAAAAFFFSLSQIQSHAWRLHFFTADKSLTERRKE